MTNPTAHADRPTAEVHPSGIRDDIAYLLPMAVFLLFTQASAWWKPFYPHLYIAKTIVTAALLFLLWKHYTPIRWRFLWAGLILGVVGIFQWVPMQLWLEAHVGLFKPAAAADVFNPYRDINSPAFRGLFIAFRFIGAVLVVPVMEELFWRDYLWRRIVAPNDFKLAGVGEWDWKAFVFVPLAFAIVHGNWWATAIVWGFMIGGLLAFTRSLGACIVMHAVTNLLLGGYVMWQKAWAFW